MEERKIHRVGKKRKIYISYKQAPETERFLKWSFLIEVIALVPLITTTKYEPSCFCKNAPTLCLQFYV